MSPTLTANQPLTRQAKETMICSDDEVENHTRAFIAAFVLLQVQSRWTEILVDKRAELQGPFPKTHPGPRRIKLLHKTHHVFSLLASVDERYRERITNAQRTTEYFNAKFGATAGVYFSSGEPPCKMTVAEAESKYSYDDGSALLSFEAGKNVLFFCHSRGVWHCKR